MSYAHRDGETAPPTVPGQYWFRGTCHGATVTDLIQVDSEDGFMLAWRPVNDGGWYEGIEHFVGQWWGPIVAPWEQGT